MNNNICQFYVVFGNRSFVPPSNNNVYINATDIHELKELSDKIINIYKEKAKTGIKVGSEIIFLIPSETYRTYTEDVIKKLKVNGKIELMAPKIQPLRKTSIVTPKPQPELSSAIVNDKVLEEKKSNVNPTVQIEPKTKPQPEIKKEEKSPIFQPETNVYRGTANSKTYNNFQKNNTNKSNKLPIIIFIISLIFFIVSLLLLLFA